MTNTTTRNAYSAIDAREPFKSSGALSARFVQPGDADGWKTGRLPEEWREAFRACVDTAGDAFPGYAVYSYGTPIAWAYWNGKHIIAVVPAVKYSVTTSRHQAQARRGLLDYAETLEDVADRTI